MANWTWKDFACAAIGLSIIAAAHAYIYLNPSFGRAAEDTFLRLPCKLAPHGKDGIGCSNTTLLPPEGY